MRLTIQVTDYAARVATDPARLEGNEAILILRDRVDHAIRFQAGIGEILRPERLHEAAEAATAAFAYFMESGDEDKTAFDKMTGAMDELAMTLRREDAE